MPGFWHTLSGDSRRFGSRAYEAGDERRKGFPFGRSPRPAAPPLSAPEVGRSGAPASMTLCSVSRADGCGTYESTAIPPPDDQNSTNRNWQWHRLTMKMGGRLRYRVSLETFQAGTSTRGLSVPPLQ